MYYAQQLYQYCTQGETQRTLSLRFSRRRGPKLGTSRDPRPRCGRHGRAGHGHVVSVCAALKIARGGQSTLTPTPLERVRWRLRFDEDGVTGNGPNRVTRFTPN